MEGPVLFDKRIHTRLLTQLVDVHKQCIYTDGTLATFLPPFHDREMFRFWEDYANSPKHHLVMSLASANEVAGVVVLKDCGTATGPFRAQMLKLLVSPDHRRKGIATALMRKLEEVASQKGLTQLMLDTTVGTPAEEVYPKLGYTRMGVVPAYGISPEDGTLCDEVWFYKNLKGHGEGYPKYS